MDRGCFVNKVATLKHMRLAPLSSNYDNITCHHTVSNVPPNASLLASVVRRLAFKEWKDEQATCTCLPRAICIVGHLYSQRLDELVQVYQYTEFGVSISTNYQLRGSHACIVSPPPLARAPSTAQCRKTQWHAQNPGGKRPTRSEPCVIKGVTCRLERNDKDANLRTRALHVNLFDL